MKVLVIEGAVVSEEDIKDFSVDGVIDHYGIDRAALDRTKKNNYIGSAEGITERYVETNHIITVFDYNGDAKILVGHHAE